jgi:hypothetical protein
MAEKAASNRYLFRSGHPDGNRSSERNDCDSALPALAIAPLVLALLERARLAGAVFAALHMSAAVKVFGCRPLTDGAARTGGRRRKTSKGGNRGKEDEGGSSRPMEI